MATYTAVSEAHETLTASTVDTVTLTGNTSSVTVVNRTGTAEIYFTIATGTAAVPAVPTVGGANTYVLPATDCSLRLAVGGQPVAVSLISSGTMAYSVEAI